MGRIEARMEEVEGWVRKREEEEQSEERTSSREEGVRSINSTDSVRKNSSVRSEGEARWGTV